MSAGSKDQAALRVALFTNFVPPYRLPLFEAVAARVGALRVFISTPMEADRHWELDWGSLDVQVQRTVTLRRMKRHSGGFRRLLQIHLPWDTLYHLLSWRPDVTISVELGARSLQAALFRLLRPGSRLVLWCKLSKHTERDFGRLRRLLRTFLLRVADGVVVNGESGASYIAEFGVPDARILRLNQPIDVARFAGAARTRPDDCRSRLLCVGSLDDRKGVLPFARSLIEWAAARPQTVCEMIWLGDGERRRDLEALPWPANLRPVFLGNLAYSDVPAVYAGADALVFPTLLDEWGLVVNEAMAAGLPVVGSIYAQAVEELIEDGRTGWTFDPHRPGSLMVALDALQDARPEVLVQMRQAVRRRIAAVTPDATGQRFVEFVRQVAADQRTAATAIQTA